MPDTRSRKIGPDHQLTYRKKSPLKTGLGIAGVVLVAVAAGWLLTHQGKPAAGRGGPGGPGGPGAGGPGGGGGGRGGRFGGRAAITVGTAPVSLGNILIQLDALGTVTPPVTATITSRVSGQLMAVYFTEGQMVKKGQRLELIDPGPYQVALEQVQGTLARDQAALANARLDLQRYQTLLAQNSIAKQQVDTQAALVKQNEAVVKTDQASVASARLNLSYTQITAPVAGRVGLRLVDVGNFVSAGGGQGLLVITQVDPIDVLFTVPEDNVPAITRRQRSGAGLPVTVFDRSGGSALAQGSLSTLDNQIDTATGTVKAKARFTNGSGALFPNQFVNARMLVDVLCNQVVVPTTAVRHGSTGDYVFLLQPDKTAKMVMVTAGPGTGETVSIVKGLQAGGTVITEGGDRLRDGSTVNLPGDRPAGSGFSGGRRGRGGAAQAGGQRRPGGQGGQGGQRPGGGQGRRGGAAAGGDPTAPAPDTEAAQNKALPTVQIPAGACSASGAAAGPGGRTGPRGQGGQGGQTAVSPQPDQGFEGRRRFGGQGGQGGQGRPPGVEGRPPGQGPGPGGFRRGGPRPDGAPQGQAPG